MQRDQQRRLKLARQSFSASQSAPGKEKDCGTGILPIHELPSAPGLDPSTETHMLFRRRMHKHWRERSMGTYDSGATGLKHAMVEWSNLWLVSTALAMTVAFAMLVEGPALPDASAGLDVKIASYLFLGFTLRAMYLSLFLTCTCALWVQTSTSIPAADYSQFLAACSIRDKPWL